LTFDIYIFDPSLDVLLCWFTWFLNKKTQNTDGVSWFG